jgi:hypothetical protein
MGNTRFTSALQIFEAFPKALTDITAKPEDEAPITFLNRLAKSDAAEDAISFACYLLDRREAVWWASQCLRALNWPMNREDEVALLTAEAWVRDPEEHRRLAALELGLNGDSKLPGVWAALAAGGSGGHFMMSGTVGPPVPSEMTASTSRVAILLALAERPVRDRNANIDQCMDFCHKLLARTN